MKLKDGIPCNHAGCLNHVTHPCEVCGRIAGKAMKRYFKVRYEYGEYNLSGYVTAEGEGMTPDRAKKLATDFLEANGSLFTKVMEVCELNADYTVKSEQCSIVSVKTD